MKKIEYLYPEIAGIYGDHFNIKYLAMCNDSIRVINDDIDEVPYFVKHKIDLLYLGAMSETSQLVVLNRLLPYKKRLQELINAGTIILTTYNATELFGKYLLKNNKKIKALGLLDFHSEYDYSHRLDSHFLGKYNDLDIIGFKTTYSRICDSKEAALFETIKGVGNNKSDTKEGIRKNNFMGTDLLGPLFIQNPMFVKEILKMLGLDQTLICEEEILDANIDRITGYKSYEFR